MWQTPKLDWQPRDPFSLDPDWQRIRQNLLELARLSGPAAGGVIFAPLPDPAETDLPDPDFFNLTEAAAAALAASLPGTYTRPEDKRPGDPVWDWRDLTRIEALTDRVYRQYNTIQKAQPVLAFTLGGDLI